MSRSALVFGLLFVFSRTRCRNPKLCALYESIIRWVCLANDCMLISACFIWLQSVVIAQDPLNFGRSLSSYGNVARFRLCVAASRDSRQWRNVHSDQLPPIMCVLWSQEPLLPGGVSYLASSLVQIHLVHILRRGPSSSRFLVREPANRRPPRGGWVAREPTSFSINLRQYRVLFSSKLPSYDPLQHRCCLFPSGMTRRGARRALNDKHNIYTTYLDAQHLTGPIACTRFISHFCTSRFTPTKSCSNRVAISVRIKG